MSRLYIWTDGSCLGNPGPGGWGVLFRKEGLSQDMSFSGFGGENVTNNQMELEAVIQALRMIRSSSDIVLTTDSKYVVQGMTEWIDKWIKQDWKTTSKKRPVKNADRWKELHELSKDHAIDWRWVKGHADCEENQVVDRLANTAASEEQSQKVANEVCCV